MNTPMIPGIAIKRELNSRGWSQADLAAIINRHPSEISEVISGKRSINVELARSLALALGQTARDWMMLEVDYRLSLPSPLDGDIEQRIKLHSEYPVKEMVKRGWIENSGESEQLELELKTFFEIDTSDRELEAKTSFKRTLKDSDLNPAEKAWLYRARQLARIMPVAEYDESCMDRLFEQLRKFAAKSKSVLRIAELLSNYGIRFVVIEPLPKAKIDGAAFWLNEQSPVVALSLRFDNIGSFWFALMHELFHIKNKDWFSFDDLEAKNESEQELRANEEAASLLVPRERLDKFIKTHAPYYSESRINNLATQLQVHPGIIVGQLQHKGEIGHQFHHKLMLKVREMVTTTAFTDGWNHPVPRIKNKRSE